MLVSIGLLLLSPSGAARSDAHAEVPFDEASSVEGEAEREFDPEASLLDQILEEEGLSRFVECATRGTVVINEICAVGSECDRDVRVSDYIELYNPGSRPVDLGCFALSARDFVAFVPSGQLDPGRVRAFGESEIGFRIAKDRDFVVLYGLGVDTLGAAALSELERVHLDQETAHTYRYPDGGGWRSYTAGEAETGWPGTFDASNRPPESSEPGEVD